MKEAAEHRPDHIENLKRITPMRRFAEPEEVAEACVWLCSDAASYILGHTLVADGGAVLGTAKVD
jgi:NAD(P)-dependent dehydrogenase (short-subunit alcohol dehydrogenase family)